MLRTLGRQKQGRNHGSRQQQKTKKNSVRKRQSQTGGDKTGRTSRTGKTSVDTNGRTGEDTSLLSTLVFAFSFFFDVDNKSGRYLAAC